MLLVYKYLGRRKLVTGPAMTISTNVSQQLMVVGNVYS